MKICKKCNMKFEDDMQYCAKCGGTLEQEILEAVPVDNLPEDKGFGFYYTFKQDLWSWEFWMSPNGRRNRQPYILYSVVMWLLSGVLAALCAIPVVGWIFGLVLLYANVINVVKRLHDVDMSGWWAIVPAVLAAVSLPVLGGILTIILGIINIGLWFYLLFKVGTKGSNQYGDDPLE